MDKSEVPEREPYWNETRLRIFTQMWRDKSTTVADIAKKLGGFSDHRDKGQAYLRKQARDMQLGPKATWQQQHVSESTKRKIAEASLQRRQMEQKLRDDPVAKIGEPSDEQVRSQAAKDMAAVADRIKREEGKK